MIALLSATWDEIHSIKEDTVRQGQPEGRDIHLIEGIFSGVQVVLGQTGVGIKRARAGTSLTIQKFKPEIVIFAGVGGALSSELKIGDIVVGTRVISLLKKRNMKLLSDIPSLGQQVNFVLGGILTENRFVHESEDKKLLHELSGAMVVDMETWGAAEASAQSKTPVISVRAVSDEVRETLPDIGGLYKGDGTFNLKKAVKYFSYNPGLIKPYLRFRFSNLTRSYKSLGKFLRVLIPRLAKRYRVDA